MLPQIPLFGGIQIPSYFFIIAIAIIIGCTWFLKLARQHRLPKLFAIDLSLVILICGFLGARILHVVYEEPHFYMQHPLKAFAVWNGGFVFFGGLLGAILGAVGYCRWKNEPFWVWADLATMPISLTYALGRLACFFNGCCYGSATDLPWAVTVQAMRRHPTQAYAMFYELVLLGFLFPISRRAKTPGTVFNIWLIFHSIGRLIMEFFRADPRGQFILGFSISTWISAILISWAGINLIGAWHLFALRGDMKDKI